MKEYICEDRGKGILPIKPIIRVKIMNESIVIQKVKEDLFACAERIGKDYFESLRGSWGWKTSDRYKNNDNMFSANIKKLAMSCSIKVLNSSTYYMFNGMVWEPIGEDVIKFCYLELLSYYGITDKKKDYWTFKNEFLSTMRFYNKLTPRFDVFAFSNGVLDMRDMTFHTYDEEGFAENYHILSFHPYEYHKDADCPKFRSFLKEVLPDKTYRSILQMYLGLGLIERGNVYDVDRKRPTIELCLMLVGTGGNGKSTLYRVAQGIFGRESISGLDYEDITKENDEGMRVRTMLRGVRFNWCPDANEKKFGRRNSEVFKKVVSGEPLIDRRIGENVKENANMPYLIFSLNALPTLPDESAAMIRRLQYIPFEVVIPKHRMNVHLSQDLAKEYAGIFNWVLRGRQEVIRRNFAFPDTENNTRLLLLSIVNNDPVTAWAKAYNIRGKAELTGEVHSEIPVEFAYDCFKKFCTDNDAEDSILAINAFGKKMRALGILKGHGTRGYFYKMYGVGRDRLLMPFVINNMYDKNDYEEQNESYIHEED